MPRHYIHSVPNRAADLKNIWQCDAPFIRESTAINQPAYRLSCQAEHAGEVVIDDPFSGLRGYPARDRFTRETRKSVKPEATTTSASSAKTRSSRLLKSSRVL